MLFVPLIGKSQEAKMSTEVERPQGIHFIKGLSWREILQRAKDEDKMIFLDCYTTWCAPCKIMDMKIFPLKSVGDFFNEHFISVKVQMDQTNNDDQSIKEWYLDSKEIAKLYSIRAYPTYLFLSSDGKPLHRAAGAFSEKKFLAIASDALRPETQSYKLAEMYDPAKMDTGEMKRAATSIRRSAPELAAQLAISYLNKLSMEQLCQKDNLQFMTLFNSDSTVQRLATSFISRLSDKKLFDKNIVDFMIRFLNDSKQRSFSFLYNNVNKVDSLMNIGMPYKVWFAKSFVDYIIAKEEADPLIEDAKNDDEEPNWSKMRLAIERKYDKDYATRVVLKSKKGWYGYKKEHERYCGVIVDYMERYGAELEFEWGWNQNAWLIFKYSMDTAKLNKALLWSRDAIMINPNANWMDTYANLLYKLGKARQALRWQQAAATLDPTDQSIATTLKKMKEGVATWPAN